MQAARRPRQARPERHLLGASCVGVRCYQTANIPASIASWITAGRAAVVFSQIAVLKDLAQKQVRLAHRRTRRLVRRHHRAAGG